jgi:hypothetical protein
LGEHDEISLRPPRGAGATGIMLHGGGRNANFNRHVIIGGTDWDREL